MAGRKLAQRSRADGAGRNRANNSRALACSHSARRLRKPPQNPAPSIARRVAEILREHAATEPELLAHHYSQAGMNEAAIEWWGKARQRSMERSALVEA